MNIFDEIVINQLTFYLEFYLTDSDNSNIKSDQIIKIDLIHFKLNFYPYDKKNIEFFENFIQSYMEDMKDDFLFLYRFKILLCDMSEKEMQNDIYQPIISEYRTKQLQILENIKKRDNEILSKI